MEGADIITPIGTLNINQIAERKDDLLVSTDDVKALARNERNKAIEKFEREIRDWQGDIRDNEHDADKFDFVFERIYEIAKEMRGAE